MTRDLYDLYETDETAEVEGVWQTLPRYGLKAKIARSGNDHFVREFNRLPPEIQSGINDENMDEDYLTEVFASMLAKTILKDLQDPKDDDGMIVVRGKRVRYDAEIGKQLLYDLKDLRGEIWRLAQRTEAYRRSELEKDVGKSESGSDGSSTEPKATGKRSASGKKSTEGDTKSGESSPD